MRALTRTERIIAISAFGVIVASSLILFALFIKNETKVVPARGGVHTEGIVGQPTFINPVVAESEADKALVRLIFADLGTIAEKIENVKDGRVWRVRLQETKWHDGAKLTSDDVIFTIKSIQDPDARSPLFASWQGVFAQRLSEREVQFNLGSPYAFFEENLRQLFVLPKHLFADIPPPNWRLSEYSLKPIGSGPFMVVNTTALRPDGFIEGYTLAPNREYVGGQPFVHTLRVRFYPRKDDLIAAFNAGQIDGMAGIDPNELDRIKRPHTIHAFRTPTYYALFINQNQHPALKDQKVREALSLALDREAIVTQSLRGYGSPLTTPLSPLDHATSSIPAFNRETAEQLLDEAGWIRGVSGVREKTSRSAPTSTLSFTLTIPQNAFVRETADAIRESWRTIGVELTINELPPADVIKGPIKNREYQFLIFGNSPNITQDLSSFWRSSERFDPGLNLSLFQSTSVDKLLDSIRQTTDASNRNDLQDRLIREITATTPALFLYSPDFLYVTSRGLRGVGEMPIQESSDRFQGVASWYLETARVLQ